MNPPLDELLTADLHGSVIETIGSTLAVADFPAPVGGIVEVERSAGGVTEGEVIGFRDRAAMVFAFQGTSGVRRGNRVRLVRSVRRVRVGQSLLGRVVNADANPIDGRPQPMLPDRVRIDGAPVSPTERPRIVEPLATGVRTIDGLLTCGRGQRLGIFAGSGVGKSVLLGMMCRYTAADVVVVALVGERGRELNEFLERDLGREGLARSVVVVATSNEPALRRTQAALTATAIAEYYRDQGKDVLLLMDSITRFAMAQREIGLSAGEPPTTRGYPPSMFSLLPKLVERAGRTERGSITAYYSVLVEGDDPNEPVADTMRGLLDGHIWLSRKLAARGQYPAIDVLDSVSRLMNDLTDDQQRTAAQMLRRLLAIHQENEDLISVGAYRKGNNRLLDVAIEMRPDIETFLRQRVDEPTSLPQTRDELIALGAQCQQRLASGTSSNPSKTTAGMVAAPPVGTA